MESPLDFSGQEQPRPEGGPPVTGTGEPPLQKKPARLVSLDAYRGCIMIVLASVGFGLGYVAKKIPDSEFWSFIDYQARHTLWEGCTFWDLIQPSFMFMVGVAMPFSYASRRARGHAAFRLWGHVLKRSMVLILLGILIESNWSKQTHFSFANVLCQIGLAYPFAYLVVGRRPVIQAWAIFGILAAVCIAFYLYPPPGPDFDYAAVGVPEGFQRFEGLFARWNKNASVFHAADVWFLNLFSRKAPFTHNAGGYQTLNFVPSIATLVFGVMAGELLRGQRRPAQKFLWLAGGGIACLVVGHVLGLTVCPIVKRIWTPAWAVYSTGWTLLLLALFYGVIDVVGWRRWALPLVVVGMNPITMYLMFQFTRGWIKKSLHIHLGDAAFGWTYGPILESVGVTLAMWLVCLWLYRRKAFIRI